MFIPSYGIFFLIRFLVMITKYTVLDKQWREAKEGKSQRQNPRSITSGANLGHVDAHSFICMSCISVARYLSFSEVGHVDAHSFLCMSCLSLTCCLFFLRSQTC